MPSLLLGPARPQFQLWADTARYQAAGSAVSASWGKVRSSMNSSSITGDCWLGCERTGVRVIRLGPVQWDGQHAPFYACELCLDRLKAQALTYLMGH